MAGLHTGQSFTARNSFLKMQLRRALIAYQVIGNSDQAFAAGNSCRISDRLSGPFGFEGKRQQKPVVAGPAIEHV